MNPIRLVVVSTSRSEFGQLAPIVRLLRHDPRFTTTFVVGGMHLDAGTPLPVETVGLEVHRLPRPADSLGLVHQRDLRDLLQTREAEAVLLLGDRFELLELAIPVMLSGAVIAHLSGGERTAGAIDDQIRDAVSKLAHLHFPAHEQAGKRLEALAEEPWRIHVVGEPGLDAIAAEGLLSPAEIAGIIGVTPAAGDAVVALHPVTRDPAQTANALAALAAWATTFPGQIFFSSPNGDPGSDGVSSTWRFLAGPRRHVLGNHGARFFRSLTGVCGLQIGNSSAGLVEAPSLGAATIDLGTRQQGRPRGASVRTVEHPTPASLAEAVAAAPELRIHAKPELNPYGDGRTATKVVEVLASLVRDPRITTQA